MTDTADNAPAATEETTTSTEPEALSDNAQAVADSLPDKTGTDDFAFVLDKYKADGRSDADAVTEQAKAYAELQSKFGAFTGAPDEYEVAVSEAMQEHINLDDYKDDPLLDEFKTVAKDIGLNNEGFNQLTELYFKGQLADTQALDDHRASEMKLLGNNADRRIENITQWAHHNLDSETGDKLTNALVSASAVEAFEAIIGKTRNAPQSQESASAPAFSKSDLTAKLTAKDEFGNKKMSDPAYAREVRKMYDQVYGAEPQNKIVG